MEKELVELFEAAKKAADAAVATSVDGGADESRCLDALGQLKKFPVTYQVLVSTQVGKRLRHLTKHPKKKIQNFASDLIEMWKEIIIKETSKNKKNEDINYKESSNAESVKVEKLQRSSSMKVERVSKSETVKIEQHDRNNTTSSLKLSRTESSVSERKVAKVDKTASVENVKVEKIAKEERQIYKDKKPSTNAAAPPKLTSMITSKDVARDKIRDLLVEAFSKVPSEGGEEFGDQINASDPIRVAVSVESAMFENWGGSTGAQKAKYRSIMFNLKDPKNPDFRRKVLLGQVKPERLINMSTADMASDQRKRENEEIEQKALFDCEREGAPKATTDQFKCTRCGQRKTTYYQLQTRSADEPMTTFVTCVNCNNHWKFC